MTSEIERALSALFHIDPGCRREEWVKAGMAAKEAGLEVDDFNSWSQPAVNYAGESDCRTVWKSFSDSGGITSATLFQMAISQGWKDPATSGRKAHGSSRQSQPPPKHEQARHKPGKQAPNANAEQVWALGIAADISDGYIFRKKGTPDGLRVYPASAPPLVIRGQSMSGYLMVPCWDGDILQTIQFIPPAGGDKLNLPGASFGSGYFKVGEMTDRVFICEGIGQAWACHTATGSAAVVCFGAGRMATVAQVLREKYAAARLVVVPDRGKEEQAATIAAAINGQWVAMPADKPSNYDANDFMQESGTDALAALLERPQSPPMRYNLLTDADLHKLPPMQWRIKGVLPAEGLAALFGASGSGKSFLALDMLQSVAAGADWFGHKAKPCPVIYCALEGESGLAGRVKAYRIRHGSTSDNIHYLAQPFSLLDGGDINDLAQAVKAVGAGDGVTVLDTLNRAAPGADENDSRSMGEIIASAKKLQMLVGGLVLLVHHTGKDSSKGLRGHSSLHAALDAAIEVRRDGDRREWLIAKSKDGEDGAAHPFKLFVVAVGTDDEGCAITSCAVSPEESAGEVVGRVKLPSGGNQRIVWDALGDLFKAAGDTRPEGAPKELPIGRPVLRLEEAITKIRSRLTVESDRQTERTRLAITGLITRGLLAHLGGWLWIV